jgi:hypothetical protein
MTANMKPHGWMIRYTHTPTKTTYTVNDMHTGQPFPTLSAAVIAARIMDENSKHASDIRIIQV